MAGIYIFSEDQALARQLLTPGLALAGALGQPLVAFATDPEQAQALAKLGASRVLLLKAAQTTPEALAPAIAGLLAKDQPSVVLVGGTLRGKHLAAHLSAALKAGMTTDAKSLAIQDGLLKTQRILYAGLAVCDELVALPAVATIPARTFLAPEAGPAGTVETVEVQADTRITVRSVTPVESEGVDISAAVKLVSVGRGFANVGDLSLARDLGAALKAELACTRGIAEDEHWLPIERYIGISGQTVKPELYLAVGLSGQVQHMVGCRESKVIVAINKDEQAPIFEAADYGIVGDLYQVLPLLTAALQN
ncbi:MAG: electron transfer flavoprotein subunit alpha/FixB family protein [Holophaga sp.]|nr:electron transfer flavoprotein subunit alpha/FixB family protein [Holophaga sp.]